MVLPCLQSQGCVWTPDFFFSAHTRRIASGPWGDILWIWQKVYWLRIIDYTFKRLTSHFCAVSISDYFRLLIVSDWLLCLVRMLLFEINLNYITLLYKYLWNNKIRKDSWLHSYTSKVDESSRLQSGKVSKGVHEVEQLGVGLARFLRCWWSGCNRNPTIIEYRPRLLPAVYIFKSMIPFPEFFQTLLK